MNNQLIIGSVQMPTSSNRKANLETMESYLAHINKNFPQVELVVFPELASTDFNKKPKAQAEELPGETTKFFSELAKKYNMWLVPGSVY